MSSELGRVLARVRAELESSGALMKILADMVIVSEAWREDGKLHLVAWIPDYEPGRGLVYKKKHIVYDEELDKVIEIRYAEDEG